MNRLRDIYFRDCHSGEKTLIKLLPDEILKQSESFMLT